MRTGIGMVDTAGYARDREEWLGGIDRQLGPWPRAHLGSSFRWPSSPRLMVVAVVPSG